MIVFCSIVIFSVHYRSSSTFQMFRSLADSRTDFAPLEPLSLSTYITNITAPNSTSANFTSNIASLSRIDFSNSTLSSNTSALIYPGNLTYNDTARNSDTARNISSSASLPIDYVSNRTGLSISNSSPPIRGNISQASVQFVNVLSETPAKPSVSASITPIEHAKVVASAASSSGLIIRSEMDLAEAKVLAQNLLSLIHNRYELSGSIGSQFWLTTNNMVRLTHLF